MTPMRTAASRPFWPIALHALLMVACMSSLTVLYKADARLGTIGGVAVGALPLILWTLQHHELSSRIARWTAGLMMLATVASLLVALVDTMNIYFDGAAQTASVPIAFHLVLLILSVALVANLHAHSAFHRLQTDRMSLLVNVLGMPPITQTLAAAVVVFATYVVAVLAASPLELWFVGVLIEKTLLRGPIPPISLILFFWAIAILVSKAYSINRERALLSALDRDASMDKNAERRRPLLGARWRLQQKGREQAPRGCVAGFIGFLPGRELHFLGHTHPGLHRNSLGDRSSDRAYPLHDVIG